LLVLDGESQFSEHGDGAGFPALEIAGGKALAGGELIGGAQDCFRRVTTFVRETVISRSRAETMLRKEPSGPSRSYSAIARSTSSRVTRSHTTCAIGSSRDHEAGMSSPAIAAAWPVRKVAGPAQGRCQGG